MSRPSTYISVEDLERRVITNLGGRNRRLEPVSTAVLTGDGVDELDHEEDSVVHGEGECELCHRGDLELTRHHLIPRSRHRKARSKREFSREDMRSRIAHLCRDCHGQIHRLFTEKELAADYNTLELLKAHEGMQKFISYIRKKH